jgi:fatty acid elongase 3
MTTQTLETKTVALLTAAGLDKSLFVDFEFHVGKTAFTAVHYPLCTVFFYCLAIPFLQKVMKNRAPFSLKWPLVIHNFFLSVLSGLLAILLFTKVVNTYLIDSIPLMQVYCGYTFHEQKGLLTLLYYWNYLLKYYELIDTLFLVFKKKPIGFLHAYHHPATLVLTWTQLVDFSGMQWVVIQLNLFVHMVMYFYYALAAMHIQLPFKQIVTALQISQFIIDLSLCYYAFPKIVLVSDECAGTLRASLVGCFILTSYLFLFIDFYNETYNSENKDKAKDFKPMTIPNHEAKYAQKRM